MNSDFIKHLHKFRHTLDRISHCNGANWNLTCNLKRRTVTYKDGMNSYIRIKEGDHGNAIIMENMLNRIIELEEENESLYYAPGGPGYQEAKKEFEQLAG